MIASLLGLGIHIDNQIIKFMDDSPSHMRARAYADLGDYYFKLKQFDKSLEYFRVTHPFLHFPLARTYPYQKNLRIFKQTRFDKEKFENAVENVRSTKKAVKIAVKREEILKKLKEARKQGMAAMISDSI